MDYKLLVENDNSSIYVVENAFYLVVPKNNLNNNINVVIDENINSKMNELVNTNSITIIRPFEKGYFDNLSFLSSKISLRALIAKDIDSAKKVLDSENIGHGVNITINTPFEDFKNWYFSMHEEISKKSDENIKLENIEPSDKLKELERRRQELLEMKEKLPINGDEKGKAKKLSTGHSTLKSFDDGFISIIFLSLVSMVVTVGTILAMVYILK